MVAMDSSFPHLNETQKKVIKMKNNEISTIYVKLIDEPCLVWRPVKARMIESGLYLIIRDQKIPDDEEWEFNPGSIVRIEETDTSEGMSKIAVERIDHSSPHNETR